MDTGFLMTGESVEHDYNVLRELLPEEVIGIMDQMLCFEVCFLRTPIWEAMYTSDTDRRYRR